MRLHRFYVSQPLGEEVVIDDISKINQWQKVFRYTSGDLVILFNGDGLDVEYSISSISPKHCTLKRAKSFSSYIPDRKITLCLSLIKKDSFELALEKCTELGVSTIIPIITERTQGKNLNLKRLHIIAIEATEQCGRGDIPAISETVSLVDAIKNIKNGGASVVFQKDAPHIKEYLQKTGVADMKTITIFIGPEGGWTPHEIDLFKQNDVAVASLGETVLRAETAAIVASSFIV